MSRERVDAVLAAVPARDREGTRPEALARAERQRRRWATQVVVADVLARRACAERGLMPPEAVPLPPTVAAPPKGRGAVSTCGSAAMGVPPLERSREWGSDQPRTARSSTTALPTTRLAAVPETDVASLGSIVAVVLAYSAAARALLGHLEGRQAIPEAAVWEYYERNRDRFLTRDAMRRGVDPFGDPAEVDLLPYEQVKAGIEGELRQAAGRRAFFSWLDLARAEVVYAHGHEHPGDPSHPDHEHRH